MKAIKWR